MENFAPKVKIIAKKVNTVLEQHFKLQETYNGLKNKHENLQLTLSQRDEQIENLNNKLKQMQRENESGTLNEAVKQQLNNYIAEIESCLTLLKQ